MGLKSYRPMTPGFRQRVITTFEDISKIEPEKSLTVPLKKHAGRNNTGRLTVENRGGGSRRFYRIIDFRRDKTDVPGRVVSIEYDPNRTARIAKVVYSDGEKRYILAPVGLTVGSVIMSGDEAEIKVANNLTLKNIPVGTTVHNVEMVPGQGGRIARSAGAGVQLMAKEGQHAVLKMPSGEQRRINLECRATIGQVGNLDAKNVSLGKAGASRWMGRRPHVRGVVKNPCDHPHGGGEGKAPIGRPGPVTPKGKPTLGYKTRKKNKPSSCFIISRRPK
jgi:large subunit ribosomal protein L2